METKESLVFIDSVVSYFSHLDDRKVEVGTPFLRENDEPVQFDYIGLIAVTGVKSGQVYFTAPRAMLKHLLVSIGEADTGSDNMKDLVGEVANTISGNVRKLFGPDFKISVPRVIDPKKEKINLVDNLRSYVIPIYWKSYNSAVVINF